MRRLQVSKVWNAVDNQARKEHTSIIHGKYSHEETVATASFATTYLIVRDLGQAQYLCDYILHGGSKEEFMHTFKYAMSEGVDCSAACASYALFFWRPAVPCPCWWLPCCPCRIMLFSVHAKPDHHMITIFSMISCLLRPRLCQSELEASF